MHNSQVNNELNHLCTLMEQDQASMAGAYARNCIVCALHMDFHVAMTQSNFSDPVLKYREEATNVQILNNVLKNLKEIKSSGLTETQARDRLQSLLAFTKGIKDQMKNPYFKAYFAFL